MPSLPDAETRLRDLPWAALEGLGPALAGPLDAILGGTPAERVLDQLLRAHRDFTPAQRTACAEACFGVGLWRRRLRALVGVESPTALQLLAVLARDLGGDEGAPQRLGVDLPSVPPRALDDWRVRWSVPDWLAEVLEAEVGAEAPALAAALNAPGPVCLRANTLAIGRDALAERLAGEGVTTRPTSFAPHGLVVTSPRPNIYGLAAFREGLFEVQDEGSQLLGALLPLSPGEEVLDLCAGAGGKSLQLAAAVAPGGAVHATDVDHSRLERLRTRAVRAGCGLHAGGPDSVPAEGAAPGASAVGGPTAGTNPRGPTAAGASAAGTSPAGVSASVVIHGPTPPPRTFDAVLVDAPCSELGALRRGPDLRWRIDPAGFSALETTQRELLETAARHVRPGGHLAYATCTLRRAENVDVVEAFLAAHGDFQLLRPDLPDAVLDARGFLKTYPHRHGTDGFFGALLVRRE